MEQLFCRHCSDWREWLTINHDQSNGVWLVFHKYPESEQTLSYREALEEALCFGWIDSLIKRIDDREYVRKFSPRRAGSNWSPTNQQKVAELSRAGRMQPAGLRMVQTAKADGSWDRPGRFEEVTEVPPALAQALAGNERARAYFERLPRSHRRQYIMWIATAKREETIERRVKEAIGRLEKEQPPAMK